MTDKPSEVTQKEAEATTRANPLIVNYGLFWNIDNVNWGRSGRANQGTLLGVLKNRVASTPVDFRDQIGIYVLYANYNLLYVGQAGVGHDKLFHRLKHHRNVDFPGRWNQFSWFGLRWVRKNGELSKEAKALNPPIASVLNHLEAILIHSAEPALNRQGGRFGADVEQYIQYRDREVLGPSHSELLVELHDRMTAFEKKLTRSS